ncbi:MAG: cupin domain-containing protein [Actinomycetota bacterium]
MAGVEKKSLDSPDETRTPEKTKGEVVHVGGVTIARATLEPGWRWSEHIKPVAGTDSCQFRHVGYCLSGAVHTQHEDGTEADITAGEAYVIEPGHDSWVTGDEPFVGLEFESPTAAGFGKES